MYINDTGTLVNSREHEITVTVEEELSAQLYFMQNPYPMEVLKDYLTMANDVGKLDPAKNGKRKEIIKNPAKDYTLKELEDKNLLDKTRKEALQFINEFKSGENEND